mmetsp:Transcript_19839/g.40259  ORF Transcript_19839/g.40259 Transcript_19839/m.40259 type:complete len:100 (+) Transcript_19839:379-678(+)
MHASVSSEEARQLLDGVQTRHFHTVTSDGFDYINVLLNQSGLPPAAESRRYKPNRTLDALAALGWPMLVLPIALCGAACGIVLMSYLVCCARGEGDECQ